MSGLRPITTPAAIVTNIEAFASVMLDFSIAACFFYPTLSALV